MPLMLNVGGTCLWLAVWFSFSLIPLNASVLTNSGNISPSDRPLPNWQPTWHVQQHGRSGMFFDISCAPVARHHLTVMVTASSRLWALREPLALCSHRDTNCVYMHMCVCVFTCIYYSRWSMACLELWPYEWSQGAVVICVCVCMCLNPLPLTDREVS